MGVKSQIGVKLGIGAIHMGWVGVRREFDVAEAGCKLNQFR